MKIKIPATFGLFVLLMTEQRGFPQGFVNLNFESANISGYPVNDSSVPITKALPAWTGYYGSASGGTNVTSLVWYDAISGGGAIISVNDTNTGFGFAPIQGKFSAYLFAGQGVSSAIAQTAMVPVGTESLMVDFAGLGTPFTDLTYLAVSIGGQTINMVPLTSFSTYTLYGGDISGFAGQVAELRFTELPPTGVGPTSLLIDNIIFSTSPVPEPGTLALIGAGAVFLGLRRARRRSSI